MGMDGGKIPPLDTPRAAGWAAYFAGMISSRIGESRPDLRWSAHAILDHQTRRARTALEWAADELESPPPRPG